MINIQARALYIRSSTFNINGYSKEQSLPDFRFHQRGVGRVSDAMGWITGRAKINRYGCEPVAACCIAMRRLASAPTRYSLESMFGLHSSHLSEIFWEVVERFVDCKCHLITTPQHGILAVIYKW